MSAIISTCGKYRYWLSREGDPTMRRVAFVMLNPSTADADLDDATIRRCRTFARGTGFVVVNLYAFRATKPSDMFAAEDPCGPENWQHLLSIANGDYKIIVAWGANASMDHALNVAWLLKWGRDHRPNELYCLGTTKSGQPRHPLYVRSDQPIIPWSAP